ncbi:MAG: tRNA lysidine(34) synthetase TilS [Anaeroplasma bactoclasticum]|nr:tRNA lysidine(34) synthetase TilS [Anaeroplasma bactoclasticum]MCM1557843.1 tRNA lysidine(34) synthetase TilS [Anaeroplasma bactoclasticum]
MQYKVQKYIKEHNLIPATKPIICAVSGGVDSVCLLHILHQLKYSLVLAHVNHHKREQASMEQKAMQELAENLNIPFELLDYYDSGYDNFQSNAHDARYTFFKQLAKKYHTNLIATAHHLNDQAETIIIRLLNGSNLYGYAGISIAQQEKDYCLIRPLLCVSKDEIYAYAKQHNLTYFEDSSNASDDYLRNRIRHHILPLLEKENVSYLEKIQEFSIQAKESFNFIRKQSINYLDKQNNSIEASSFLELDVALKKDILCLLFERYQIEKNFDIIIKCVQLIEQNKNCIYHLKDSYSLVIEYGKAYINKKEESYSFYETLKLEDTKLILNRYKFYFSKKIPQNNEKYLKLCYNDLKLPFFIRNKKEGDFINMSYGNKKVARILIDEKIPVSKRNQIPLVFDQEGNLLWIYNLAKSQAVQNQKDKSDIFLVCEEV